ncbi:MAG: ATP-dependent RNA helicase [Treponema sp.]|uniref:ATP-dependent RNA helicase n=1 Tax=Treponema sp. TaxID=166 RepID=UPI00298E8654|nr:ATP-dependent RNA helicase [Treponema sp.]MCQ2600225.1 ATP-dependent RNA helicase [Treponema sp.]
MALDYKSLPVYEQKQRILDTLKTNQVIIVQSPTGSGKTTQIPVILHEAGYSDNGVIAVTQPRRIAALSVSEFISKQLGTSYPGLVGYKMRFEDKTDLTTRIKIMTDGILLQEMKLDPMMKKYSVIMVDEAHERSLNIDFVLGLLKRVLKVRPDLKIIVSSATMNAEKFSTYFDGCPIVTIDTITYPVTVIYDPPTIPASTNTLTAEEALLSKISNTIDRILYNRTEGDILIFLPGEKAIKDCINKLYRAPYSRKIQIIPLYGRLPKEEQEKVFDPAPFGRKKVIISTNIAETSVTIDGITSVIDSGLAKLNFYSPRTYTSSLIETPVSKASCNQRRGRAGRTQPGTCYRLYPRKDYDTRESYTIEEIFRTDLSEVVLRMAELGITDFETFDFISQPPKEAIRGAVETLRMLKAINPDNTLSSIGNLMVLFPLPPRVSRIIVESILKYPEVMEEVLIAAAFLSTHSPFVLPQGEEMDARRAHHTFRDIQGDFVSYVKLYRIYQQQKSREQFCKKNYLDEKVMAEIENIVLQLSDIVSAQQIPITGGGPMDDYLCCIASGMIQFVCVREGRENFRTLTADHISIHPGSNMFRTDPMYIVAGEIVRTSRMFAMSVSPLTKGMLAKIDPSLEKELNILKKSKDKGRSLSSGFEYEAKGSFKEEYEKADRKKSKEKDKHTNEIKIGSSVFNVKKVKGKQLVLLPLSQLLVCAKENDFSSDNELHLKLSTLKGRVTLKNGFEMLNGEKLELIFKIANILNLIPIEEKKFDRKLNININEEKGIDKLCKAMEYALNVAVAKSKSKEMGFIAAFTDNNGNYWFKVSRGFSTALSETLSTLETLIDEAKAVFTDEQKNRLNEIYRKLNNFYED